MSVSKKLVKVYILPVAIFGILYGLIEYLVALSTETPEAFWPLMARVTSVAIPLGTSIGLLEIGLKSHFSQRPFLYLVLVKAILYTLILSFWLLIVNGIYQLTISDRSLWEGMIFYWNEPMYFINLFTIFGAMLIYSSLIQINSLHRKGELFNFITGRFHQPREVERIFAFIDLKGSTTIAEILGHLEFGQFLKDFYADITQPIMTTRAEIYQYVGDEIILSWKPSVGLKKNNAIRSIFGIQQVIDKRSQYYKNRYGHVPRFRSSLHIGKVLVTWVGELKKEILYIGDVMNTTARIQEDCKRLGQDLLISGEFAEMVEKQNGFDVEFLEQAVPRGKEKPIELYAVKTHNP